MSHKPAITALKKFTKTATDELPPEDFISALKDESDRGTIILAATMLDDALKLELRRQMPSINAEEAARIFEYEGLAGSYANRLKLAQAMGIIDRPMRNQIELIREMRNAAAHSRRLVNFSTPEIRDSLVSLIGGNAENENLVRSWPDDGARDIFCLYCGAISDRILGLDGEDRSLDERLADNTTMMLMGAADRAGALPDKSQEASS